MPSEREVRTRAGWIGVEISRSRVRTAGKAGYGLYRVRGSRLSDVSLTVQNGAHAGRGVRMVEFSEWTGYLFTLDEISDAVDAAIREGMPATPGVVRLRQGSYWVPTRWTSAYRGARDLGVAVPVAVKPEYAAELDALTALVDAGLVVMRHELGCSCSGTSRLEARCVRLTTSGEETVGQRRRRANAEFQAEHRRARDAGLAQRHARKLSRRTPGT